ncbi:MAG: ferrous iron transport protein B [Bacilli bacterium]|nr:ferrous iron transport protein B [Bacilli bacterium]
MGLTNKSTGKSLINDDLQITRQNNSDKVIALAGNPNVGKSTVFNELTGLNQHTGNWPGKTVTNASGEYVYKDKKIILVDIPGTYSLMANSVEEEVARDFICFGNPDMTVVVADATCLERNLNLVLQILEVNKNVVVCVNLLDEAKKKNIDINLNKLSKQLGVPVVGTSARSKKGLDKLKEVIYDVAFKKDTTNTFKIEYDEKLENIIGLIEPTINKYLDNKINSRWLALKLLDIDNTLHNTLNKFLEFDILKMDDVINALENVYKYMLENNIEKENIRDLVVSQIVRRAGRIYKECVTIKNEKYNEKDKKIDKILTSKIFGIPIMLSMLGIIFWITIAGANYPSSILSDFLFKIQDKLTIFFEWLGTPDYIHGILVLGVYRTVAWVVSVMLPPMAIFFPLFTLLEDSGYLPRIAFNMDKFFKKACAHGKQALTMCMGFGCNACGVIGCRIIDSPRERLIAIITNNFVPCNGRFPTLIAIITMFFVGTMSGITQSFMSALLLTTVILLGILMTLFMSKLLSKTILKGMPSSFVLELPPYRRPQVGKVIIRSIFDRTLFVLGRAIAVAAPAGLIIWIFANVKIGNLSILSHCTNFLDPFARVIGLDGVILMAFILGFPANEIVIPLMIMTYMSQGSMIEFSNLSELKTLLVDNGWTYITAICTMLFSLMHFPCGTTCATIKKETGSFKWTLISVLLPTLTGIILCFLVANISGLLMMIF